ncbi:glycosyltransferase [Agromyces flavus]|uniref:glycosyltransferase n=1 Tax=Agromyces flavus TaxID=589382 RepID=UPI00361DCD7C
MPLHDDDEWVASALESCTRQTLRNIEIICVDDASTDRHGCGGRCAPTEGPPDPAPQAGRQPLRLPGTTAWGGGCAAPYVLFLDGDDELAPDAARVALRRARVPKQRISSASRRGGEAGRIHRRGIRSVTATASSHAHRVPASCRGFFPQGKVAQGQLWRNLYRRELLLEAYSGLPDDPDSVPRQRHPHRLPGLRESAEVCLDH